MSGQIVAVRLSVVSGELREASIILSAASGNLTVAQRRSDS